MSLEHLIKHVATLEGEEYITAVLLVALSFNCFVIIPMWILGVWFLLYLPFLLLGFWWFRRWLDRQIEKQQKNNNQIIMN